MRLGAVVLLNSHADKVEESGPRVFLSSGEVLKADVIVGADGIRSRTRACVLGGDDASPTASSNCAFRATVPRDVMLANPVTHHLMNDVLANCWIGYQKHIMAYPIRGGQLYNLVMSHPGHASVGKWNEAGNMLEKKQHYRTFDPAILAVLENVDSCLKWELADLPALPTWVSSQSRVVLIGDAAHSMLPYLAQGAAIATEDGASLAECLSRATEAEAIPKALAIFHNIRKPRCETIQALSRTNGDIWHLPDGPEQNQRDQFMTGMTGKTRSESGTSAQKPNRWSDNQLQPWPFGYDVIKEVRHSIPQRRTHFLQSIRLMMLFNGRRMLGQVTPRATADNDLIAMLPRTMRQWRVGSPHCRSTLPNVRSHVQRSSCLYMFNYILYLF